MRKKVNYKSAAKPCKFRDRNRNVSGAVAATEEDRLRVNST
jgi:hypothetical protein